MICFHYRYIPNFIQTFLHTEFVLKSSMKDGALGALWQQISVHVHISEISLVWDITASGCVWVFLFKFLLNSISYQSNSSFFISNYCFSDKWSLWQNIHNKHFFQNSLELLQAAIILAHSLQCHGKNLVLFNKYFCEILIHKKNMIKFVKGLWFKTALVNGLSNWNCLSELSWDCLITFTCQKCRKTIAFILDYFCYFQRPRLTWIFILINMKWCGYWVSNLYEKLNI